MSATPIDDIDAARRRGELSWDDYARLLKNHPDGFTLVRQYRPIGGRDHAGRLRELEDLGRLGGRA